MVITSGCGPGGIMAGTRLPRDETGFAVAPNGVSVRAFVCNAAADQDRMARGAGPSSTFGVRRIRTRAAVGAGMSSLGSNGVWVALPIMERCLCLTTSYGNSRPPPGGTRACGSARIRRVCGSAGALASAARAAIDRAGRSPRAAHEHLTSA